MMLFKRDSVYTVNLRSVICLKQRARKDAKGPLWTTYCSAGWHAQLLREGRKQEDHFRPGMRLTWTTRQGSSQKTKEKHWKLFRNPALLTLKGHLRALISRRKGGGKREGTRKWGLCFQVHAPPTKLDEKVTVVFGSWGFSLGLILTSLSLNFNCSFRLCLPQPYMPPLPTGTFWTHFHTFFFQDKVSCATSWPQTHRVAEADLEPPPPPSKS